MEKTMERIQDKLTDLIGNGWGINQAMDKLGMTDKDVIKLMEEDNELCKKLQKRFKGTAWIDAVVYKGKPIELLVDRDTPELAALKAEARELGIEFNPQIGYEKLKKRVDEFKAKQAE